MFFYNFVFKKKKEKEKLEVICQECYAVQHWSSYYSLVWRPTEWL